jgi:hypothetical protein
MDRNRDLTDGPGTKGGGTPGPHVHRGLAQVDRGIVTDAGGVAPPPSPPAGSGPGGTGPEEPGEQPTHGVRGVRTRLYRDGALVKEDFPAEQISDYLEDGTGCVVWLDLCAPDEDQLAIIGSEFGLHALAIEDALDETQRTGPRSTGTAHICSCRPTRRSSRRAPGS